MASPERTRAAGHGLLLVRAAVPRATTWVRRGLVAGVAVQLDGWTGICPTDRGSRAAAPYDVAVEVLAGRPVRHRDRPAIGAYVIDGCAVVTVQERSRRRAGQRWLVWEPGAGVRRTPDLDPLPAAVLVGAAGATGCTAEDVAVHLRQREGNPLDVLTGLLRLLGLPGEDLLVGGAPTDLDVVDPRGRGVARFDTLMADEAVHRRDHADEHEAGH